MEYNGIYDGRQWNKKFLSKHVEKNQNNIHVYIYTYAYMLLGIYIFLMWSLNISNDLLEIIYFTKLWTISSKTIKMATH